MKCDVVHNLQCFRLIPEFRQVPRHKRSVASEIRLHNETDHINCESYVPSQISEANVDRKRVLHDAIELASLPNSRPNPPIPRPGILVVEDDDLVRSAMAYHLNMHGFDVHVASSCALARQVFAAQRFDVVVTDFRLGDGDALGLIGYFRVLNPRIAVLVLTGYGSIELAVRAVREGAMDFLTKPVELARLLDLVRSASNARAAAGTWRVGNSSVPKSDKMRRFMDDLDAVAGSDAPLLVLGETGTGKSTVAREIHLRGPRATKPFVDVNCGGLRGDFLESELFGHERGSFTGAVAAKAGLLESADGGTLFLDEIGDIDLAVQAKILKVLEEKRFRRLGDVRERNVDVRLIAATHHDIDAACQRGAFRWDLYYRINTLRLDVPPLRERIDDLDTLVTTILERLCERDGWRPPEVASDAMDMLRQHAWPGNVRELRNVLERAVVFHRGDVLRAGHLRLDRRAVSPLSQRGAEPRCSMPEAPHADASTLQALERSAIMTALIAERGRVAAAAKRLGIARSTLYQKVKTFGLDFAALRAE